VIEIARFQSCLRHFTRCDLVPSLERLGYGQSRLRRSIRQNEVTLGVPPVIVLRSPRPAMLMLSLRDAEGPGPLVPPLKGRAGLTRSLRDRPCRPPLLSAHRKGRGTVVLTETRAAPSFAPGA